VKGEILLLEGNKKERQDTRSYIVKKVRFNAVNGCAVNHADIEFVM
jgi:hypothetical protein